MTQEEIVDMIELLEMTANENEVRVKIEDVLDMLNSCSTKKECIDWISASIE